MHTQCGQKIFVLFTSASLALRTIPGTPEADKQAFW